MYRRLNEDSEDERKEFAKKEIFLFKTKNRKRRECVEVLPAEDISDEEPPECVSICLDVPVDADDPGKRGFRKLCKAILDGNTEQVKYLMAGKINVCNKVTRMNVLHTAAKQDIKEMWELLFCYSSIARLAGKANKTGMTPLLLAVKYSNKVAIDYLLDYDPSLILAKTLTYKTVLHFAAEHQTTEIMRLLLSYREILPQINHEDKCGNTALMYAILSESPTYKDLIDAGTELRILNSKTNRNALHFVVVRYRSEIFDIVLNTCPDKDFVNRADINGDSPFMLAVLLSKSEPMEKLLQSHLLSARSKVNKITGETCLHIIIKNDKPDLLKLIFQQDKANDDFINIANQEGDTPFMYAIKLQRQACLDILVGNGAETRYISDKGNTVLHYAVLSRNIESIKKVLTHNDIAEIINVKNGKGQTAFDIALSSKSKDAVALLIENCHFSPYYTNDKGESTLFIAVKSGRYETMQYLLLSPHYIKLAKQKSSLTKKDLIEAELNGDIFSSDLFILTGIKVQNRGWIKAPSQQRLFRVSNEHQNIFHACALGGSVECLAFILEYCKAFNGLQSDFDVPDRRGETPLFIAVNMGAIEITKLLLLQGACLTAINMEGVSPLVVLQSIPNYESILTDVLDECITVQSSLRHVYSQNFNQTVKINFQLLCPPGRCQMDLVHTIFTVCRKAVDIYIHPVIDYFIHRKFSRIRYLSTLQFFDIFIATSIFSIYLFFSLSSIIQPPKMLMVTLFSLMLAMAILNTIFLLPNLFTYSKITPVRRVLAVMTYLTSYATLFYFLLDPRSHFADKIGAITALMYWFSLLHLSCLSGVNCQIHMYFTVIEYAIEYLYVTVVVMLAFSISFFVLYHKYMNFNNPFHSLVTTVSVLSNGGVDSAPYLMPEISPSVMSVTEVNKTLYGELHGGRVLLDFVTEGMLLLIFDFTVCISLLNMLVALSVKGTDEVISDGHINRIMSLVAVIWEMERFADSWLYKIFWYYRLTWLIGCPADLRERLSIPLEEYPVLRKHSFVTSMLLLKLASRSKNSESIELKPYLEDSK